MTKRTALNTHVQRDLDPDLLEFFRTYVDSFVKWELLLYFNRNPHTTESPETIAGQIGRSLADVEHDLAALAEAGILQADVVSAVTGYTLAPEDSIEPVLTRFLQATDDPAFRRRAIYHLVRR